MARSLLCPDAFLSPLEIDAAVSRALAEDLGRAGDITATATIPEDTPARAIVVARAAGVISGLPLVAAAFAKLAPEIVEKWQRTLVEVLALPDIKDGLLKQGLVALFVDQGALGTRMEQEVRRWREVVVKAGIQPD